MVKIVDEKQTGKYRVLILDGVITLDRQGQTVKIGCKRFNAFSVHGIDNAISIICPQDSNIKFKGCVIEKEQE